MSTFCFKCDKCEKTLEQDNRDPTMCCGQPMYRDYHAELPQVTTGDYRTPLVSDSLAVNISQINAHRKLFPNIEMTSEGQPIFRNYRQHDDYLNKIGAVKITQKIRSKTATGNS